MKKILLLLTAIACVIIMRAQTITDAEYFIDTDPGAGNGIAVPLTAGANVNFNATIPVTSLANGFHFLCVRTRGNDGKWGLYQAAGIFVSANTTNVPAITNAEYFIDSDPGVGNGINVPITSGSTVNFAINVPTTSLTNGFHFLAVRIRNANGNWSLFETRGFYVSSSATNAGNIVAAEFFVDADPGVGNGTSVAVSAGTNVTFVATVPTTSLADGFHFIAIRTRNTDGHWSLYENRGFYISNATNNAGDIVAAEFFVDNDPGPGNGTAISVTPGTNVNFVANVPAASLANGFHFIAIRVRNSEGKWSLFENRGFYISTQTNNVAPMIAAEYFIDTDPGPGNGTPFTIPGGNSFNQNFVLNIPPGTSNGQHFIAIRVANEWGLFAFDTIEVSGALPLQLLSFDAFKRQNSVLLKWRTTDEINTSHFEIERSSNGTQFQLIGSVPSANAPGIHDYSFEDHQPFKALNFYRIRQVDIDGKATYSRIVRVLFETFGAPLTIYPNPADHMIQFEFGGRQRTIMINVFDAAGRQVLMTTIANQYPLQLNVSKLSHGKYTIQLSDGETIQIGSFIKN